jgi:hypothetical protein
MKTGSLVEFSQIATDIQEDSINLCSTDKYIYIYMYILVSVARDAGKLVRLWFAAWIGTGAQYRLFEPQGDS